MLTMRTGGKCHEQARMNASNLGVSSPLGQAQSLTQSSAAYYYITWGIWLRHCLEGHHEQYQLHWPRPLLSVPEVRKVEPSTTKTKQP